MPSMTILCYSIAKVDWLIACFACIFNYFSYQFEEKHTCIYLLLKRLLNDVNFNNSNKSDLKPLNDACGIVIHISREKPTEAK